MLHHVHLHRSNGTGFSVFMTFGEHPRDVRSKEGIMSFGTRFRKSPEATSSLKTTIGAALIGAALLGGSLGVTHAQDASPEASPAASPVATIDWIEQVPLEDDFEFNDDRASVGVNLSDEPAINVAAIEFRPYIVLQTANFTDMAQNVAVFSVPDDFYADPLEFDAATFTFPASEDELPEGVTAVGGFQVAPDDQSAGVFQDLAEGSYVLASDGGIAVAFTVVPMVEPDVPDLFGTPEATPDS